jgi:hypothetical protein
MPVNNVNYYALEKVLEAAKRYQKISEWLGHSPLDDEDATLDSCVFMVEKNLKTDVRQYIIEEDSVLADDDIYDDDPTMDKRYF